MSKYTFIAAAFTAVQLAACSGADPSASESTESDIKSAPPVTSPAPSGSATPTPAPAGRIMPGNLHWTRNSAEYQAGVRQVFALAGMQVEEKVAYRYSRKPWGVVLDSDETILNNSQFQKEGWEQNIPFSPERWTAWVQRKEAKAIPGAAAFLKKVHALGGKIVIVTNRMVNTECPDTEQNFKSEGLEYDLVLCKSDTSDKNPRFATVTAGTAAPALPALDVLMFVGDNILDFPALDQTASTNETKLADFGSRFIIVPNPMYGSWEKNPQN